jgi:hypothetical protein
MMTQAAKERWFRVLWVALMREHEACPMAPDQLARRAREIREACA